MKQFEIIEWLLITIFLFIILLILYRRVDMREGMTDTHSGSDERYTNVVSHHYREMINTFNLGVGILAGTIVIFRNT